MPKTSIIITVYNRANLLRNCLISLMNQSRLPDELIISDDGSQQDIKSVVLQLLPDINFKVKYVRQEDKGFRLARCRNNGVRFSEGDFLIFLDQDLIFTKNLLKTFFDNYEPKHFCVCYPLRLTENQTRLINDSVIRDFNFNSILEEEQQKKIRKQYRKDKFYYYLKKANLRKIGTKFRGGAVGINRGDFFKINGYDEKYIGWGNEDDDLGYRLYKIGTHGKNISYFDFPIHLYHEPFHINGERINKDYHLKNRSEIDWGKFRAAQGLENPSDAEEIANIELN